MIHLSDKGIPLHEKVEMGMLLAIIGGFLDAHTYLFYGGVFANAQTGNMVLFGISLVQGDIYHSGYYLLPILAFALGILLTEYIQKHLSCALFFSWYQLIIFIEAVILLIIAFLPDKTSDIIINSAISFICSIQVNSFRRICGSPYTSTMCTGNLRSGMEMMFHYWHDKDKQALMLGIRYFMIIVFFCFGAAIGAVFTTLWGKYAITICVGILLMVLILMMNERLRIARSVADNLRENSQK